MLGGYVAGGILDYAEAHAALAAAVSRNTEHFDRALRTVDACLEAGMPAAISLEDLERERQEWLARHWHTRASPWTGTLRTVAAEEASQWLTR